MTLQVVLDTRHIGSCVPVLQFLQGKIWFRTESVLHLTNNVGFDNGCFINI